jgi:hypothetical protein
MLVIIIFNFSALAFSPPLETDPVDGNHHIHAPLLRTIPLVRKSSILLVVPKGAYSAVHAAAAGGTGA